jgi:hypothetical protein
MGWVVNATPRPLYSRERDPVPIVQEAEQLRKISTPPGFDPRTLQPVASRYTDCAIPALFINIYIIFITNYETCMLTLSRNFNNEAA